MGIQGDQEARLIIAAGEASPDLYFRTRFLTPDPYIYLEIRSAVDSFLARSISRSLTSMIFSDRISR